ncbi:penicillin-binding protein activator [Bowmanella denitrificans]|uniref:penicillin-binding protein activator n=1 Tax=Bowmanella denitrificans TaxID=366582 RepID=UPI001558F7C0|nr:penicillin-binding protein activator [Bowmanella denitrificans]
MSRMRTLTYAIAVIALSACSSAPKVSRTDSTSIRPQPQQAPIILNAQQYLQQARLSVGDKQKSLLLNAALAFRQEQDCTSALKVLKPLLPALQEQGLLDQGHFLQARCLTDLGHWSLARSSLQQVSQNLHILPKRLELAAELAEHFGEHYAAAGHLADLASLQPDRQQALNKTIWKFIQQTPDDVLRTSTSRQTALHPWVQLADISRMQSGESLATQLMDWQNRYGLELPEELQPLLALSTGLPKRIGIILPLSGRLANQGEALKDGILAAYFTGAQSARPELHFIDSLTLDNQSLATLDLQYDFIVGPLLKENLDAFLPQLPAQLPILALNRLDQPSSQQNRYFYSLAPEDEAEQLASILAQKGYKTPLVVNADRPVFERMTSSFTTKWQALNQPEPRQVSFTDNKSMRAAMESLLDVNHSKQRIGTVEKLVKQEVHAFARNRRDVDVIVVFASAAQTELLNPIIESSISPFAQMVPVYASSRSFSQELGSNSLRDLRHLTFVDMPWMLSDENNQLRELSRQLWPQRNDGQSRLFAMGYDAYNLLPNLAQMASVPHMTRAGLTGSLSMDEFNQLRRSLPLGRVEQEKVIRLAMD